MSQPTAVSVKNHKTLPHSRHEFEVEVSAAKMTDFFEKAYHRLAQSVEVKGFRPGQAPRMMTLQKIGQQRYFEAALEMALPHTYQDAVKELAIRPVSPPEISIVGYGEGAPFTYKVAVDVIPDVDPGDYQKVRVTAPKVEDTVAKKEVDEVLDRLKRQQATVKEVDREAKKGDRVEIDYAGHVDNVKRDEFSSQHFPLIIGDKVLPDTLEEALIGKKKGDTFELTAPIEKEQVKFQVAVHSVSEVTPPEEDEKFAKQFDQKSMEELRTAISDQLKAEKVVHARQELETKVLDAVLKQAKLEIPKSLLDEEITRRIEQIKQQLGVMYTQFLNSKKKTEDELRKELEEPAKGSVTAGLVLGEIAKREGFGVDRHKDEDDPNFQKRVVRRTIDFLVANATGEQSKPVTEIKK